MSNNSEKVDFNDSSKGLTAPPTISISLLSGTQYLFPATTPGGRGFPRSFFMKAAGVFAFKDALGNSDSYPVLASQVIILENVTEVEVGTTVAFSAQY
ncbi:MAG: hypothetical protein KAS32_29540 [Candidatus Peribacteraceae bacterium]|nr:hypothetical protein [Candidatus Peribacteraceae bacterium]